MMLNITYLYSLNEFGVHSRYHLIDLVVVSPWRVADPRYDSCFLCGDFYGSSPTSDLKIGTPVATLPDAWHCRVSAETGWPGISIL